MKVIINKILSIIVNRVFILGVIIACLFSILVVRSFYLQIVKGEEYIETKSYNKREVVTEGIRGNIYDMDGRPLAINDYVYSILYLPEESSDLSPDEINRTLYNLIKVIEENGDVIETDIPLLLRDGEIIYDESFTEGQIRRFKKDVFILETLNDEQITIKAKELYDYIKDELFYIDDSYGEEDIIKIIALRYKIFMNRYRSYQPVTIAKDVNEVTYVLIKEHQNEFPGAFIDTNTIRVYPYGEPVAHMVGYIDTITDELLVDLKEHGYDQFDKVGISGIEKKTEFYLRGNEGKTIYEVDNAGNIVSEEVIKEPEQGDNVYLTIDAELQVEVYQLIEKQLIDILLNKIVLNTTKDGQISLDEVFFATINNYMLDVNQLSHSVDHYSSFLYNTFSNQEEVFKTEYKALLFSDTNIKDYGEQYHEFYIEMAQRMKIDKHFKYNSEEGKYLYQSDDEIFDIYKQYEISALDFFEYCIKNEYLDLTIYGDLPRDSREAAKDVLQYEFLRFVQTESFQFEVYEYILINNVISDIQFIMVLYEQGIITGTEQEIAELLNGVTSPLSIVKNNLREGKITPRQLGLNPSSGSVVITDVNTGEVISLVSYPSYDNNLIMNDSKYKVSLFKDKTKPLYYLPIQQTVVPGSTFKMLSAITALEEGVITPYEQIYSKGTYENVGIVTPPSCWAVGYGYVHGLTDIRRAIEVSCNYFFSEVAYRLGSKDISSFLHSKGISYMREYMHYLGLDAPSGIELGESAPILASNDALRAAFGNNNDQFTATQLARYTASLANGGTTYDLYLIDSVISQNGEKIEDNGPTVYYQNNFKEENLLAVQEGMYDVGFGENGTARRILSDMSIEVAGKTGTAQNNKGDGFEHGLFVGYAPYEQPQISISVILPFSGSSYDAADLFKEVVEAYFNEDKVIEEDTIDNKFLY